MLETTQMCHIELLLSVNIHVSIAIVHIKYEYLFMYRINVVHKRFQEKRLSRTRLGSQDYSYYSIEVI